MEDWPFGTMEGGSHKHVKGLTMQRLRPWCYSSGKVTPRLPYGELVDQRWSRGLGS